MAGRRRPRLLLVVLVAALALTSAEAEAEAEAEAGAEAEEGRGGGSGPWAGLSTGTGGSPALSLVCMARVHATWPSSASTQPTPSSPARVQFKAEEVAASRWASPSCSWSSRGLPDTFPLFSLSYCMRRNASWCVGWGASCRLRAASACRAMRRLLSASASACLVSRCF